MYFSITDPLFWLFSIVFVIGVGISWYLPGLLLVKHTTIKSKLTAALIAICLGLIMWGIQGYIFGYLQLRWLSYVYLLGVLFFSFKNRVYVYQTSSKAYQEFIGQPKSILGALILGIALQLIVIIGSGFSTSDGVVFFFNNAVDGVMHLSYIQSIVSQFPPAEPGTSGVPLQNYHFWGDLVTAELARLWFLPVIHLFFQFVPFLLTFVSMQLTIQLTRVLKGTNITVLLVLFFLTFGSDLSYIFSYYLHQVFQMDIAILDNGITFLFNMPQAFARLLLLSCMIFITEWVISGKLNGYATAAIVLTVSAQFGFKVYYGIYEVLGLACVTLFVLFRDFSKSNKKFSIPLILEIVKNQKSLLIGWLAIFVITAAIYLPTNKDAGGLMYSPFEWPRLLLSSEHLDYTDWWLRLQVYEAAGNTRNIAILYTIAVIITFFIIHGTRLVGLLPTKATFKRLPSEILLFILPTNIIFFTVGMLYFQVSGGFNIYNFFLVPTLSLCLLGAFNLSIIKDSIIKYLLIFLIVCLTLPRSISQITFHLEHYWNGTNTTIISHSELELLEYIKNNSSHTAVVLSDPNNGYDYLTPYISFFTQRSTYFSGVGLLVTHNQRVEDREKIVADIFSESNLAHRTAELMKENNIDFLIITDGNHRKHIERQLNESGALTLAISNEAGLVIKRNE